MVSQDSIDLINYSKDLDIEFNTKLIVMCLLLMYAIIFLWMNRVTPEKKKQIEEEGMRLSSIMLIIFGKILAWVYIFNLPMIASIYLFREVLLEQLILFVITIYVFMYMFLFIFGQLWTVESVISITAFMLGFDIRDVIKKTVGKDKKKVFIFGLRK